MEDITKSISIKNRLLFTSLSALICIKIMGLEINNIDITLFDQLLKFPVIATIFSIFAIVGLTNSYNIIDGLNGLSSMVASVTLLSIASISYVTVDFITLTTAITLICAILGFFLWNFPSGSIFLGDCGAYLLGFSISILSVILVKNNLSISPWFVVLINAYPIIETLFSVYRRKFHKRSGPVKPDALHLHSLFYRRIFLKNNLSAQKEKHLRNSATSPYLWGLNFLGVVPALIFYKNTTMLIFFSLVFIVIHLFIYIKIIKFKTPHWLLNNIY